MQVSIYTCTVYTSIRTRITAHLFNLNNCAVGAFSVLMHSKLLFFFSSQPHSHTQVNIKKNHFNVYSSKLLYI